MYQEHPGFPPPSDVDISIWRYMDLAKFLSLLEDEALHCTPTDRMPDEFEGSISKLSLKARRELLHAMPGASFERYNSKEARRLKEQRAYMLLNCWHMNEHESAAMWALYQGSQPQGIAVRSTYRRLRESVTDLRIIFIAVVEYIDYEADPMPRNTALYRYMYKRRSFEHERELRALYLADAVTFDDDGKIVEVPPPDGIKIAVDLDQLVDVIYVSPKAPAWFADLVRSLLRRYGRGWDVNHSSLDRDAIY